MATIAFIFAGYEDKKTASSDNQADTTIVTDASVGTTVGSLTSELDTQLSQDNVDTIQASLTSLRSKYTELAASGKLDTARTYAARIQLFLSNDVEKIKAATADNATIAAFVSGIQDLPTTAKATAEQAETVIENNAEEMMKEAEFEANKTIDKAKQETTKATDNVNAKMNEAKDKADKAFDESAEKANREMNQAREQVRKGLGL